jgi:outer membrane receptor protein involved in Fe transport
MTIGLCLFRPMMAILLLTLARFALAADAENDVKTHQNDPERPVERVVVVGNTTANMQRDANASKIIVTREDLTRFGDTSIADALQRVPGITVSRTQGKDVEIRLRGLGNGYTQILVDGAAVPAGFSLESLSPELIDHIEILRSPTADLGSQAIAGTVNIILKRANRRPTRSAKVAVGGYDNYPSANVSGEYADRSNGVFWGVSSAASVTNDVWPATSVNTASTPSGEAIFSRTNTVDERNRLISLSASPSIEYKADEETSFGLNGWIQAATTHYSNSDSRSDISGEPPQFISDVLTADADTLQGRVTGQVKTSLSQTARLESKLMLAGSRRSSDAELNGNDATGDLLLRRTVQSVASERSVSVVGKILMDVWESHTFASGWDGQAVHRSENRSQRETSPVSGYPTEDLDEAYTAGILRLALFAQDEWTVSTRLSAYFGLRWEGLQTRTDGQNMASVSVRSSVVSPIAQLVWKIPDTKADQVRVNFGRTYKAPTARELIPRRWVVSDNSPTTPNFQGNPDLLPELAWGVDAGYERYFDKSGFVGLSAFVRRIDNVILPQVSQIDGAWVEIPQNSGRATVRGLEFEFKTALRALFAEAPDLSVRIGLTRNWSDVEQVPGPDNRLARQPKMTASVGADWRIGGTSWTSGANYSFEEGSYSRYSVTSAVENPSVRKLDLYGLWEPDKSQRVRLIVSNALAPIAQKNQIYADENIVVVDSTRSRSFITLKAQLELAF